MQAENALCMKGITKSFGGVRALDNVNFSVLEGEMHAIVGENGAGKSTLMKILSGVYPRHSFSGEIEVFGRQCQFSQPRDAEKKGIAIIHQELMVLDELSIAENILLGHLHNRGGVVNWRAVEEKAREALALIGLETNVKTKVAQLGVGQKQLVEIAKALSLNSRILIFDEPTAALSDKESSLLFSVIEKLRQQGITIIYISHRMEEVFAHSQRITVMRDGHMVDTLTTAQANYQQVVYLMVGREITDLYPRKPQKPAGDELLRVEDFTVYSPDVPGKKLADGASFCLQSGEIVGFSGLLGAGRTELLAAVCGMWTGKSSGQVYLRGKPVSIRSPRAAIRHGIGFITEDRKKTGLIMEFTVGLNTVLPVWKQVSRWGLLRKKPEAQLVAGQIEALRIKTKGAGESVKNLSGGNQQKVAIGKWLTTQPAILVMDEPTRGVDVGAKSEIYRIMRQLADAGVGIVMISSDLPEVLGMSDRIYVMHEGTVTGCLDGGEATEQSIMSYATGILREEGETANG